MNQQIERILKLDYAMWKVLPSGEIVGVAISGSYTNPRVMVGIDETGYSCTY